MVEQRRLFWLVRQVRVTMAEHNRTERPVAVLRLMFSAVTDDDETAQQIAALAHRMVERSKFRTWEQFDAEASHQDVLDFLAEMERAVELPSS